LRSNLPTNHACQGLTEHKHELKGPLATSFRKGISSGNSSVFDQLWFCKGQFCQSHVHVRVKNLK
jgi:predicted nucleic acid binding AN1-type Zn finger protein